MQAERPEGPTNLTGAEESRSSAAQRVSDFACREQQAAWWPRRARETGVAWTSEAAPWLQRLQESLGVVRARPRSQATEPHLPGLTAAPGKVEDRGALAGVAAGGRGRKWGPGGGGSGRGLTQRAGCPVGQADARPRGMKRGEGSHPLATSRCHTVLDYGLETAIGAPRLLAPGTTPGGLPAARATARTRSTAPPREGGPSDGPRWTGRLGAAGWADCVSAGVSSFLQGVRFHGRIRHLPNPWDFRLQQFLSFSPNSGTDSCLPCRQRAEKNHSTKDPRARLFLQQGLPCADPHLSWGLHTHTQLPA